MHEEDKKVTIGGETYTLVFTLAALILINRKYGSIQNMSRAFNGPTIEEGDDEETVAKKNEEKEEAQASALNDIPWLIATLANQGRWLADPKAEPVDPERLAVLIKPKEVQGLMQVAMEAMNLGMATENELDETRDPILEELDAKKAEGAAV